jgi:hypothetical protein
MFFDSRQQEVAERQQQVLARSALLRGRIGADAQVLRQPLALVDQVRRGWQWLRGHPEVIGGGVLLLTVVRPRRMWRLGSRLWAGWRLWQRLRRWQAALPAGRQRSTFDGR